MPTPAPASQMEEIVTALRSFKEGATIEEIQGALTTALDRRSVIYRLARLIADKRVVSDGTRYRLAEPVAGVGSEGGESAASVTPQANRAGATVPPPASATAPITAPSPGAAMPPTSTANGVVPGALPLQPTTSAESSVGTRPTPPATQSTPIADATVAQSVTPSASPAGGSPPPSGAAAGTPPTPPAAPDTAFDELFEACLPQIIASPLVGLSAITFLQLQAAQYLPNADDRRAFTSYSRYRLQKLTLAEADQCGIPTELFERWHALSNKVPPTPATSAPAAPMAGPVTKNATSGTDDDDQEERTESKEADAGAKRKSTSRGGNSTASSPRGLAKMIADQVMQMTGGNSATLKILLTTVALGVITPLIHALTSSPWATVGVLLAGAAIFGLVMWARSGQGAGADDGEKQSKDEGVRSKVSGEGEGAEAPSNDESVRSKAGKDETAEGRNVGNGGSVADVAPGAASSKSGPLNLTLKTLPYRRYIAGLGIGLVVAIAGGLTWYFSAGQRPSLAAVRDHVASSFAPLPVQVATIDVKYGASGRAGCSLTFQAVLTTTAPLYRRLKTADYLSTHAVEELKAIEAANTLLRGPSGARLRVLAGDGPVAGVVTQMQGGSARPQLSTDGLVLLTTQTQPGFSSLLTGALFGYRQGGTWAFTSQSFTFDRSRFPGEPKPAGDTAFAVDLPADAARLNALLAEYAAYAARIQEAAKSLAADLERERAQKAEAFAQLLQPGTLFTGQTHTPHGDDYRVVLEITEANGSSQRLTASLRNDGGWADARVLRGDWSLLPEGDACGITLRTRSDDVIMGAGPLVQDQGDWTMTLQLRPDGTVTDTPGQWQLRRVAPADAAAVKEDLSRAIASALAATRPGQVYRGTATAMDSSAARLSSSASGFSSSAFAQPSTFAKPTADRTADRSAFPLVLRWLEQENGSNQVRATLETPGNPGATRAFRGTIVDNTYRVGSSPIRLQSSDSDRVTGADAKSPLGLNTNNNSFAIALRVQGTQLVGQDKLFRYQFQVAAASGGDADVGTTSNAAMPGGSAGVVSTATYDGQATGGGSGSNSEIGTQATETYSAGGNGVAGGADPGTSVSDVSHFSDLSALPPFSTLPLGAYALVDGHWQALPENKGRIVQSKTQSLTAKLIEFRIFEDKKAGVTPTASKDEIASLTFDGRDPVPVVQGNEVVLVYIGRVTPPTQKQLEQYPELKQAPAIELAPTKTQKTGAREAPLYVIVPGFIGFATNRVEATIEQPATDTTLLTRAAPLPAGRYALFCGARSYEVVIE